MSFKALTVLALASTALSQTCPITFDGRMPTGTTPASFDAKTSLFGTTNVLGAGLTWSKVIQIPGTAGSLVGPSLFDAAKATVPFEVTISDASVFNKQVGFRRAELNPATNDGKDSSTTGVKTLHFSVMKDNARPLNLSHEYQLVFLETAAFDTNQFVLKTGKILSGTLGSSPDNLILVGNVKAPNLLFETPFLPNTWHNFAVTLDFVKNTAAVAYSAGNAPLASVKTAAANDVSGRGQYHFGMLKKPVGGGADITKSGFQEAGINEGIIYGGIFLEDSSVAGCISLKP